MNFEIEKREFLKGLGLMQSVAGRKTTLPILSHILLEWEKSSLYLTGTDLETGIREELVATIHQEGKASVSAKKLYEIVRELSEETMCLIEIDVYFFFPITISHNLLNFQNPLLRKDNPFFDAPNGLTFSVNE